MREKREITYRLWPMLNALEIPCWFALMESRGLRFDGMCWLPLFARFRRHEKREAEYCWDYCDITDMDERNGYFELCGASGWELVWQFGRSKIFRAVDGSHPAPIQEEEIRQGSQKKAGQKGDLLIGFWLMILGGCTLSYLVMIRDFIDLIPAWTLSALLLSGGLCGGFALWRLWWGIRLWLGKKDFGGLPPMSAREAGIRDWVRIGMLLIQGAALCAVAASLRIGWKENFFVLAMCSIWAIFYPSFYDVRYDTIRTPWGERRKEDRFPSTRRGSNQARTLAGAIALVTLLPAFFQSDGLTVSRNFYCERIIAESEWNRDSNEYYLARDGKNAERIQRALLRRDAKYGMTEISPGGMAEGEGFYFDEKAMRLISGESWEKAYQCGDFVVLRRGEELWRLRVRDSETADFLRQTGF